MANALLFLLLFGIVVGDPLKSAYYEIHPGAVKCSQTCETLFSSELDQGKEQCSACCDGCRFLAFEGVSSEGGVLADGLESCNNMCGDTFEGKTADACKAGCKQESAFAVDELKKFQDTDPFSSFFDSLPSLVAGGNDGLSGLFNQLDSFFGVQPAATDTAKISAADEPKEINLADLLNALLPPKFLDESSEDDVRANNVPEVPRFGLLGRPDGHEMRRGMGPVRESVVQEDESTGESVERTLNGLWNDRHSVQVLLIVSITACLFAVIWMLLNSGNNPIVQISHQPRTDQPPAYETVIIGDKKKMPMLFVAGCDEQAAPPLPIKVAFNEELPNSCI
jgi:hypothetical protein